MLATRQSLVSPRPESYDAAERALTDLLRPGATDGDFDATHRLDAAVATALPAAYGGPQDAVAERFLQRTLYRINRLMLFWYDDLHAYERERSPYLLALRDRIERAWQAWELLPHDVQALRREPVVDGLRRRAARDVDPPPSDAGRFFRDEATLPAYRMLLAIASLDALVEASQLSRTLGGVSNDVHATLTRLLLEEYGGGRPARKHSAYFHAMLTALGMDTTPEAYFDVVPAEVLAGINQSFLLSDRKRFFLRYVGGLLYTEVSVPAAFRCYRAAAERLGLPSAAMAYWDVHIKEDARHGPWMLNDVALPLAARYPADAWELLLGYDQQRGLSARAGAATARAAAAG
jgi:heme oxygenase-like protein